MRSDLRLPRRGHAAARARRRGAAARPGALCAARRAGAAPRRDRTRRGPAARGEEPGDHGRARVAQPGRLGPPRAARRAARRVGRHRREDCGGVPDRSQAARRHSGRALPRSAEGGGAGMPTSCWRSTGSTSAASSTCLRGGEVAREDHPRPGRLLRPQRLEHGPSRARARRRADPRRSRPLRGEASGGGREPARRQAADGTARRWQGPSVPQARRPRPESGNRSRRAEPRDGRGARAPRHRARPRAARLDAGVPTVVAARSTISAWTAAPASAPVPATRSAMALGADGHRQGRGVGDRRRRPDAGRAPRCGPRRATASRR